MASKLKPIVLSGPSGCGKSTIIKKLMSAYPNRFGFSVSRKFENSLTVTYKEFSRKSLDYCFKPLIRNVDSSA